MQKRKYLLWFIFLITILAVIIDLPKKYRPFNFLQSVNLVKGLDLAGGAHLMFQAKMDELPEEDRENALSALQNNIERRVNFFGVSEAIVQTSKVGNDYRLIVELPGVVDVDQAVDLVGKTAQLEFREQVELEPEATESATLNDVFAKKTDLSGKHLVRAEVQFNPNTGQPEVGLEFNDQGEKLFAQITETNVGKPLAIFLDEQLISAPRVNEKITGGKASISGDFSLEQAKELSSQLNAGALPVGIELIERRQIGPTLGAESVEKSFKAGLIGLGVVIVFMAVYYGWLGVIADIGLIIYGLITLALYKLIPVTLTLPGLTGFLLSVGMAVDSNILIFERMKEELKDDRPWNAAMELGFGRAWDSIRDANVCTLIICFLLFNPFNWGFLNSSGMVRGFALTLALGIFVSMFTGIVVTQTLLRTFGRRSKK
jgi:preprotein translocase subunit SecD